MNTCTICREPASQPVVAFAMIFRLGRPSIATAEAAPVLDMGAICARCSDAMRRSTGLRQRLEEALTRAVSDVLRESG